MAVAVLVVVAMLVPRIGALPRTARVFAEDQRLDRHRHRVRRHAHAPEVHVVEIPERDAVDHQHLGGHGPLFLQERAKRMRDVAVEHEEDGLRIEQRHGERLDDAARERGKAPVGGRALPAERERHFRLALLQVECLEVAADRLRHARRVDIAGQRNVGLQDLQVLARQERGGIRDVDRVAGELHAVFGRADGGRADALARGQQHIGKLSGIDALPHREPEALAEVAEVARLAAIDVFGDAPREHHARDSLDGLERIGEPQRVDRLRRADLRKRRDEAVGHPGRNAIHLALGRASADAPVDSRIRRQLPSRGIEASELAVLDDGKPSPDMDRRGMNHFARFHQGDLGGAAADVHVQHRAPEVVGGFRRPRAVRGEERLHVVARGGADEFPAHLRNHVGDRLGVLAAQRLAGEDHGAGVDLVGMDAGRFVGRVDDVAHGALVDARLALVGREHHRRLVQRLALHHEVAAGELLGEAAHVDAREDHLRAGRADVDPHRDQRDVVLQPQRVVLEVVVADGVVVVVMVVLALDVLMHAALAHQMVEEGMLLRSEGFGHLRSCSFPSSRQRTAPRVSATASRAPARGGSAGTSPASRGWARSRRARSRRP